VSPYAVVLHGICVPSNDPDQQKASRKKWEALLRDAFWQSAFSGVNPEEFYLVKTSLPLHRYVTYRKMENGQEIHWTGRKILIPAGTRVFTDGQGDMYLCTCGNQVAAALPPRMQGTVLPPEEEPPVAYLVPLEPEPFPGIPRGLPGATPLAPPEVATATHSNESESILPTPPIFEGGPSPWENWPRPGPNPKPPSHPVAVPESSTFSLIPIAFCAIILALYFSKRR